MLCCSCQLQSCKNTVQSQLGKVLVFSFGLIFCFCFVLFVVFGMFVCKKQRELTGKWVQICVMSPVQEDRAQLGSLPFLQTFP